MQRTRWTVNLRSVVFRAYRDANRAPRIHMEIAVGPAAFLALDDLVFFFNGLADVVDRADIDSEIQFECVSCWPQRLDCFTGVLFSQLLPHNRPCM